MADTHHHAPDASASGPLPPVLAASIGPLLSRAYGMELGRRNRRFDRGIGTTRVPVPVISVGNLSVGGTGKTPMVRRIVSWLVEDGHHPCVAMRGYKARQIGGPEGARGDEADEYLRTLPTLPGGGAIPIVAQPDRLAGLRALLSTPSGALVDRIVLDDGFQHRQIARELDIVLIDATRDPFRDRLLPAGWLREPVENLRRAGVVVVTHAENIEASEIDRTIERIREKASGAQIAVTRHAWIGLQVCGAGLDEHGENPAWLAGKRVLAVCAIGNPRAFLASARLASGGSLAGEVVLPDHDRYSVRTIGRITQLATSCGADVILTTEKDWSKLRAVDTARWPCPIARPNLDMRFDRGEEDLRAAIRLL